MSNARQGKTTPLPPAAVRPPRDNLLSPRRFAFLVALLVLVSFPEIIFYARCFFIRDYGLFGYPLAWYHRQSFWHGEIPLWNPLSDCGSPFLAQWNTLTLYPLSLIYLVLPLPWSLGWFCLLHLFMGGIGMYFLARRWSGSSVAAGIAGAGYAFNALALNSLEWPNTVAALAWTPWVVITVEKAWQRGGKYIPLAALVAGTQMLTGAPEMIALGWVVIGAVFCAQFYHSPTRSSLVARLVAVIFLTACLAAAQLLPFLDLLARSQRDSRFGVNTWSMPSWGWANLVVPLYRCFESPLGVFYQEGGQFWTSSYYMGLGILALALAGAAGKNRHALPLSIAALTGLVLASGQSGKVYSLLLRAFPFLGFMRFPIKFVILAMYALPLLAAFGVAAALAPEEKDRRRIPRGWLALLVALTAIAGLLVWASHAHAFHLEQPRRVLWSGLSRVVLLASILAAVVYCRWSVTPRSRSLLGLAAVILVWLDAITHAPNQNPTAPATVYEPGLVASQLHPAPAFGTSRAMMSRQTRDRLDVSMRPNPAREYIARRMSFFGNCNLLDGIPLVEGFYSLHIREQKEIFASAAFASANTLPDGLLQFLGVSRLTDRTNDFEWETRAAWQPLITIGRRPLFLKPQDILPTLLSPAFDPGKSVLLPEELKTVVPSEPPGQSKVSSESYAAQRISAQVETDKPALVTIAQTYYWPWTAYVDGKKVDLLRVNHAFQGLVAPAGRHRIDLVYQDDVFRGGVLVSVAALAACAWMLWRFSPRRGNRQR